MPTTCSQAIGELACHLSSEEPQRGDESPWSLPFDGKELVAAGREPLTGRFLREVLLARKKYQQFVDELRHRGAIYECMRERQDQIGC